jgi:hypothetical protein
VNGSIGSFDLSKFIEVKHDLILTNGMAYRYIPWIGTVSRYTLNDYAELFHVKPDELTRWYIVNAGPRKSLDLNFAAAMMDVIYPPSPMLNQPSIESTHYYNYSSLTNENTNIDHLHKDHNSLRYLISIPPWFRSHNRSNIP